MYIYIVVVATVLDIKLAVNNKKKLCDSICMSCVCILSLVVNSHKVVLSLRHFE